MTYAPATADQARTPPSGNLTFSLIKQPPKLGIDNSTSASRDRAWASSFIEIENIWMEKRNAHLPGVLTFKHCAAWGYLVWQQGWTRYKKPWFLLSGLMSIPGAIVSGVRTSNIHVRYLIRQSRAFYLRAKKSESKSPRISRPASRESHALVKLSVFRL